MAAAAAVAGRILVAAGGYVLSLRPGFFPVEHSPRGRAFCGVGS
ncbi:MAG: hypothetical protein ABI775_09955 [Pseudonocardiales bacterium]